MKKYYAYLLLFLSSILLISCSQDTSEMDDAFKSINLAASINSDDLVGEWQLSVMQADTLVDLNLDGSGNKNLLNESACFNEMKIIFNQDKTFSTVNARLDFEGGTNNADLVCMKNRTDFGTWDIEESDLILNINIDGTIYTQRKPLTYNTSTFAFDVSKAESNIYVSDPGDTSASKIRILALEYSRI